MKPRRYILVAIGLILLAAFLGQFHRDIPAKRLMELYGKPPSRYMHIDGMQVHYRDEGEGFPVVLIHGMSSTLRTWDGWAEILSHQYRVIRMDLPGFGITGPNANNDYSDAYYVNFMQQFLDSLGVKQCYMVGNSLGGRIAWQYDVAHPEQVRKLVLVDAAGYPIKKPPPVFSLARIKFLAPFFSYFTPRYFVEKSCNDVYGDPSKLNDTIVDMYFKMALRKGNREAFIAFVQGYKNADTTLIREVKAPTLIIWGGKDRWIPKAHAEAFHRDIADSKVIIFPHLGHIPMEEKPVETCYDVLNFFGTLPKMEQ
jgi:pimeloyl-ACP methyl ester carboxylesterase